MKKKKHILIFTTVVLTLLVLFSTIYFIYQKYYKIDYYSFHYRCMARIGSAPDNKHNAGISLYRITKESDISYIEGIIYTIDSKGHETDSKIIFWQKVKTSSLMNKSINGMLIDDWVDFYWVDTKTVYINGITLDINSTYDYRRE